MPTQQRRATMEFIQPGPHQRFPKFQFRMRGFNATARMNLFDTDFHDSAN
jgi:hypothetical protein